MTLIVSAVCGPWAFQASDRRLSVQTSAKGPLTEWDASSNKTIIVVGADCWLVIGYTGIGYLNGRPTDQYLAECITGIDDLSDAAAMFWWSAGPDVHYREIRNRVAVGLEKAYAKLLPGVRNNYKTAVLASGLQRSTWQARNVKRVTFRVDMLGPSSSSVELVPRHLPWWSFNLSAVGMCHNGILNKLIDDLSEFIRSTPPDAQAPDRIGIRDLMMQAVRDTAATAPDTVGKHVVGAILNPYDRNISTVFSAADPSGEPPIKQNISEAFAKLPRIPTPWLLRPGISNGPSVGNPGGLRDETGFTFEFGGFDPEPPDAPGGGYFGSQPRKGPPR